ncbi:hypothetical protein D9M68_904790 [compost metagenome]
MLHRLLHVYGAFIEHRLHALFLDVVVEEFPAPQTANDDDGGQDDGVAGVHWLMGMTVGSGSPASTFIAIVDLFIHVEA